MRLPAVVLTDLNRFTMKVLVDEIDVRQVAVGQPVRLSVDALPDTEITGKSHQDFARLRPTSTT